MRKVLIIFIKPVKWLYSRLCTFFFKRMIHSYGDSLGVNSLSISSSKAIVNVGNNVNFNGVRIIGRGGGTDR